MELAATTIVIWVPRDNTLCFAHMRRVCHYLLSESHFEMDMEQIFSMTFD